MKALTDHQQNAFWSKVDIKTTTKDCWNWTGAKKPSGYGNVRINKKYYSSHRVAFELSTGPIPEEMLVCHICDNPSCCNPAHLMLGTIKSNSMDMLIKNRQKKPESAARGTQNGNSKLDDTKVTEIRAKYLNKEANQYQLAEQYGITQSAVGALLRRKTWRHVA